MTIRSRLALTYGLAVAVTIAALGGVVLWQFGVALRTSLEQRLETRIAVAEASIENDDQGGLQEGEEDGDLFVVILTSDGRRVDASATTPPGLQVESLGPGVHEVPLGERRFLIRVEGAANAPRIAVGADLQSINRAQASLTGLLVLAGAVAAVLSGAGGWWLAGRALRPVAAITEEAAAIGASDLGRRLPEPNRSDELGILARTLNGMLARIEDAVRRQRAFVAAASHDLRTPLAALQAELELADSPSVGPDELRSALTAARGDVARLAELAADLLQLASVSADGRQLVVTSCDLSDVVETALRRVAPIAERARVRIINHVAHSSLHLDRTRIEQALTNLLVNAVTYSSPGGEVDVIRAESDDPMMVSLEVHDRGPGVPESERDAIFEPFRRGARARGGGAGLGLATVRAAVDAHLGSVSVDDRPGGGATFRMRLPIHARRRIH